MKRITMIMTLLALFLSGCQNKEITTVSIIVPLEHQAMDEIVQGFKEVLGKHHPEVEVVVKNAQGDQTLLRTIIQQMVQQNTDILVPIGTATSQMTVAMRGQQAVVSLAAYVDNLPENQKNLAVVQDEIPMETHLNFMHQFIPELKKVTVIYSAQDKSFHEVEQLSKQAKGLGIELQKLMVKESHELFTISKVIAEDSQAVFILKDHPIASNVQAIIPAAIQLQVPVITSDEGSIKGGGCFALGVKEGDIGRAGGLIAHQFLAKESMSKSTIIDKMHIFVNQKQCKLVNVDLQRLESLAKQLKLGIEAVG